MSKSHTLYVSSYGSKSQIRGYDISFPDGPTITLVPGQAKELHRKLGLILDQTPEDAIDAVV